MTDLELIVSKPGRSNLVLTMPHSASEIPEGVWHLLNLESEDVRRTLAGGVDLCVPFVTGFHDYKSAARVHTNVPRVVLDVNRLPGQADKYAVEGGSKELDPHGLIWRVSMTDDPAKIVDLLTRPYTWEEFSGLRRQLHDPYIEAAKTRMDQAKDRHGIAIRFDLHSMPGNRFSFVQDGKYKNAYLIGKRMERGSGEGQYPDIIVLGSCVDTSSQEIRETMMTAFRDHGLLVDTMPIRPTTKGSSNKFYADPENGYHSIGVEIVGYNFEPVRTIGELGYNNEKEDEFRAVFSDVFKALEGVKG